MAKRELKIILTLVMSVSALLALGQACQQRLGFKDKNAASFIANGLHSEHVWIVTEENKSYEGVIGNPDMPYLNTLANQYGLATQHYANQHSSLPALMWLVAGAPVEPNNDTTSCQHANDNIVRQLLRAGYSWRAYQVNMPSAGYQGLFGGPNGSYYRRHNPLIDFTDICPGTGQENFSVPYTQVTKDLASGFVANYAYITPDADEDLHSGTAAAADNWLKNNLPLILVQPEFQPGGDGVLFITFDEGDLGSDNRCSANSNTCDAASVGSINTGGGKVATLVIGPNVKRGYKSTKLYHHQNLLKTVCVLMGLPSCPGAARDAEPMLDFFNTGAVTVGQPDTSGSGTTTTTTTTSGVTIVSPSNTSANNGGLLPNPIHVIASAMESVPINQLQVWDNGVKLGNYPGSKVDTFYTLSSGTHTMTITDLNNSFQVINKATVTFTVQ